MSVVAHELSPRDLDLHAISSFLDVDGRGAFGLCDRGTSMEEQESSTPTGVGHLVHCGSHHF